MISQIERQLSISRQVRIEEELPLRRKRVLLTPEDIRFYQDQILLANLSIRELKEERDIYFDPSDVPAIIHYELKWERVRLANAREILKRGDHLIYPKKPRIESARLPRIPSGFDHASFPVGFID